MTHHYEWNGNKLIIGKFCQIADELINLLLNWKWWDKTIDEINSLIPILINSNLELVKSKIESILNKKL